MREVKKYLDSKFKPKDVSSNEKKNGQLEFHGYYQYQIDYRNFVSINVNNETMQFRVMKDGMYQRIPYGYLQTYLHIPRGLPDKRGYYARSTDKEVIKYIKECVVRIKPPIIKSFLERFYEI